jgi:chromosome partitioning protein
MSNCKVIALTNQKGGVGKTTTAVNLGVSLAQQGKKVLLIDADAQANLTMSLGYNRPDDLPVTLSTIMQDIIDDKSVDVSQSILHHGEGVDLLPSNIELSGLEVRLINAISRESVLKTCVNEVKKNYDYCLIDCMPSLGMLTINALAAADSVVIPTQPHYLSAKGLELLLRSVSKVRRQINPPLRIDGILLNSVLAAMVLPKGIVGLAGINPLRVLGIGVADGQRLPTLPAFEKPREQARLAGSPRTLAGFELALHDGKVSLVHQRLMRPLHHDPVLRPLTADSPDLEAVLRFLGSNRPGVDGIHQQVFYHGEVPDIFPVLRVLLLPPGADVAYPALPVPPYGAGELLFLQPAPDMVRAMPLQCVPKYQPDNGGCFRVDQQVVLVLRVFPVSKRGDAAGKLAFLRFQQVGRMDFLGNVLAVHLISQPRIRNDALCLDITDKIVVDVNIAFLVIVHGIAFADLNFLNQPHQRGAV